MVYAAVVSDELSPADEGRLFLHVDPSKHPRLSNQKASDDNRRHVAGHLRKSVHASYIKDLYEDYSEYLTEMISVTKRGFTPRRIEGQHKVTLDANTILECGSWDGVLSLVTESLFDRLCSMSNTGRITQMLDDVLGLDLDLKVVATAQPYIELRHLLVHADGIASPEFCIAFPDFGAYEGENVKITTSVAREARTAVTELVEHIDSKAVAVGLVVAADMQ